MCNNNHLCLCYKQWDKNNKTLILILNQAITLFKSYIDMLDILITVYFMNGNNDTMPVDKMPNINIPENIYYTIFNLFQNMSNVNNIQLDSRGKALYYIYIYTSNNKEYCELKPLKEYVKAYYCNIVTNQQTELQMSDLIINISGQTINNIDLVNQKSKYQGFVDYFCQLVDMLS